MIWYGIAICMVLVWYDMVLVLVWYSMVLILVWYGIVLLLVWYSMVLILILYSYWYGIGMHIIANAYVSHEMVCNGICIGMQ